MCALCGILVDGPHWTEAGTNAGRSATTPEARKLYLERVYRIKVLNQVLRPFGAVAEDWAGGQYIVRNRAGGASDVTANLPALWKSLDYVTNGAADPLDPDYLKRIEQAEPVTH